MDESIDRALRRAFEGRTVPEPAPDMESRLQQAVARALRQARAVVLLLIWTSATAFLAGFLLAVAGAAGNQPIALAGISLALAAVVSGVASAASNVLQEEWHPGLGRRREAQRPGG